MKHILTFLLGAMFAIIAMAEPPPPLPAELRTLDGKEFKGVTLRSVTPDGVQIMHDDGAAKIAFANLPEELRVKFGYDPAKAAEFSKRQAEQAQLARTRERYEAAKTASEKAVAESKINVILRVIQVLPDGVLGRAHIEGGDLTAIHGSIFVACPTDGYVDGNEIRATIYPCGTYSYTDTTGARATIKRFASTVEKALVLILTDMEKKSAK